MCENRLFIVVVKLTKPRKKLNNVCTVVTNNVNVQESIILFFIYRVDK